MPFHTSSLARFVSSRDASTSWRRPSPVMLLFSRSKGWVVRDANNVVLLVRIWYVILKRHDCVMLPFTFQAWKADSEGNLVFRYTARNFNPAMATACKVSITPYRLGLCLLYCYQPLCVVSQQSWFGLFLCFISFFQFYSLSPSHLVFSPCSLSSLRLRRLSPPARFPPTRSTSRASTSTESTRPPSMSCFRPMEGVFCP